MLSLLIYQAIFQWSNSLANYSEDFTENENVGCFISQKERSSNFSFN